MTTGDGIDHERLAAAGMVARSMQPYLAVALSRMVPVACPGLGTVAVDRWWRLYLDEEVVAGWSVQGYALALLHEVGHLLREHPERGERAGATASPLTARLWNLAGDALINHELDALPDREWPLSPVLVEHLRGARASMSVEEVYELLRDEAGHELALLHGDCGSAADGERRDFEADSPGAPGAPEGVGTGEDNLIRKVVAEEVRRHAAAGDVPGGWERWAREVLEPVVDWRAVLRRHVRSEIAAVVGRSDYSYGRPSRRRVPGVVLPAMRGQRPPRACVVLDTSGSMTAPYLDRALAEVQGVVRSGSRRAADVITCDTRAYDAQSVRSASGVVLHGGGGTDLRVGLSAAVALRPRPGIVVLLTDGFTPWPSAPLPGVTVVVALLGAVGDPVPPPVPSWARTVRVELPRSEP